MSETMTAYELLMFGCRHELPGTVSEAEVDEFIRTEIVCPTCGKKGKPYVMRRGR